MMIDLLMRDEGRSEIIETSWIREGCGEKGRRREVKEGSHERKLEKEMNLMKITNNEHEDKKKKCEDEENVYCDRFVPSQRQMIVDDVLTSDFEKMRVSMEIENNAVSKRMDPGYALLLQRDLLDVDGIGSISLDKHTQLEQLKKQKKSL